MHYHGFHRFIDFNCRFDVFFFILFFFVDLFILIMILVYFHMFHIFIDFNCHFGVLFVIFMNLLILTVILLCFHCYNIFCYCHLVSFHGLLNFKWHFGVIFMIFIYFTYISSKSQNLTLLTKTWTSCILKLLIFLESLIGSNFFNTYCMNILTRGNDSPDYVAILTYIIC